MKGKTTVENTDILFVSGGECQIKAGLCSSPEAHRSQAWLARVRECSMGFCIEGLS